MRRKKKVSRQAKFQLILLKCRFIWRAKCQIFSMPQIFARLSSRSCLFIYMYVFSFPFSTSFVKQATSQVGKSLIRNVGAASNCPFDGSLKIARLLHNRTGPTFIINGVQVSMAANKCCAQHMGVVVPTKINVCSRHK